MSKFRVDEDIRPLPDFRDWVFDSVGRLEAHPMSRSKVPEVGIDRIREIIYGAYPIIYSIDERAQKIPVLTVRRGSEMLRTEELELKAT
jgi:hypothetical protein